MTDTYDLVIHNKEQYEDYLKRINKATGKPMGIDKVSPKESQIGGDHYKNLAIQPGEYITKNNLGWYEGNVVKYVTRHKFKNGKEDLLKAIHYLELAIEEYYG